MKNLKVVALVADCAGLGFSVIAKYSAMKSGNISESAKAERAIQEGMKRIKRDISGSF